VFFLIGLAGLVHNYYALGCALFASLGGLTFGYDQGVVANVLVMRDFQMQFPMTPLQQGLLTAVLELGALFGALAAGILADRLSRRYAICTGCAIFCVGSAFQASASTLWWLGLGRALGGVGIGSLRFGSMTL
jgi:MFS family permease